MRSRFLLALGVALAVGSMAQAATPPLSPAIIGEVDGILSSCSKIDPRDQDKFEKLRRSLIPHGVPDRNRYSPHGDGRDDKRDKRKEDDDRKKIEKDPSYQANFVWMQTIFKQMAPAEALKLCKAAV
jgi:hypothetical protein